jgi:hypothetical protein
MPSEQPPAQESLAHPHLDAPAPRTALREPIGEEEAWLEETEQLPRRPRRRLTGPLPLALLAVLLTACGFIGGALVEKGEASSNSSTSSAAGLASRFAALRGGAAGAGAATRSATGAPRAGGGFTRPTSGTVAYLAGSTMYVTNSEGNTVTVTTSPATSVSKMVKSSLKGIHPGETVTIVGATGSSGTLDAESISVGSSAGGGLAGLFGRGGGETTGGSTSSKGGESAGGQTLFGGG